MPTILEQIARFTSNEPRLDGVVNGSDATDIQLSDGTKLPSLKKLFKNIVTAPPSGWMNAILGAGLSYNNKGDPGGNVMAIGLFATAAALNIPNGTDLVQTSGYNNVGRGAARYSYDPNLTDADIAANPDIYFKSNNGRRFRLSESLWNAEMLGAVGDGIADDTAPLKRLINTAIQGTTISLSRSSYIITSTLPGKSNVIFDLNNATIRAAPNSQFEYMLQAQNCSGFIIRNGTFDANRQNRSSGQSIRFMGVGFAGSTDCRGLNLTVRNVMGFGQIPGVGFVVSGNCVRCGYDGCSAIDCGVAGLAADGFFVSGFMPFVLNSIADNCWDTGFVLESCDFGLISGCTANNCSAGGAITNASATDRRGNRIVALTINNWISSNTGGVQIGVPNTQTGNLLDSVVDVIMSVTDNAKGVGPAIAVRQQGFGRAKGVTITGRIVTAKNQGILVDGDNVVIRAEVSGTGDAAIQYQTGSSGRVENSRVFGGGSYGVIATGTAKIEVMNSTIYGVASFGVVAFDTSTIKLTNTTLEANGAGSYTKDTGATITDTSSRDGVYKVNGVQVVRDRRTGWTASTGPADKATPYAVYIAPAFNAAPTANDLQGIANKLQNLSQRYVAAENAMREHGLIN